MSPSVWGTRLPGPHFSHRCTTAMVGPCTWSAVTVRAGSDPTPPPRGCGRSRPGCVCSAGDAKSPADSVVKPCLRPALVRSSLRITAVAWSEPVIGVNCRAEPPPARCRLFDPLLAQQLVYLALDLGQIAELAVDRGEADVGHVIQLAKFLPHPFPDLPRRDLHLAGRPQLRLELVHGRLDRRR